MSRVNHGYEIVKSYVSNGREVVIGHDPNAPDPYACWYCKNQNQFYRGYYANSLESANAKFDERVKLIAAYEKCEKNSKDGKNTSDSLSL